MMGEHHHDRSSLVQIAPDPERVEQIRRDLQGEAAFERLLHALEISMAAWHVAEQELRPGLNWLYAQGQASGLTLGSIAHGQAMMRAGPEFCQAADTVVRYLRRQYVSLHAHAKEDGPDAAA